MTHGNWLIRALVLLAAAVVAVPWLALGAAGVHPRLPGGRHRGRDWVLAPIHEPGTIPHGPSWAWC